MRMKRSETQLLVENWRKVLKGEELPDANMNEGFFDKITGKKPVLKLLKAKITARLTTIRAELAESYKKMNDGTKNVGELMGDFVHSNRQKIAEGQVMLYLQENIDLDVDDSKSKRVSPKGFNEAFEKFISSNENVKKFKKYLLSKVIGETRPSYNPKSAPTKMLKNLEILNIESSNNAGKIEDIGKKIAALCK